MQEPYDITLYLVSVPLAVFMASLIVTIPLAITRGRILLKILVTLGSLALVALILITIWMPMTLIGLYLIFPVLMPSVLAGIVTLLVTGEKASNDRILKIVLSCLIISISTIIPTFLVSETFFEMISKASDNPTPKIILSCLIIAVPIFILGRFKKRTKQEEKIFQY